MRWRGISIDEIWEHERTSMVARWIHENLIAADYSGHQD
jgi:hypothetical protein